MVNNDLELLTLTEITVDGNSVYVGNNTFTSGESKVVTTNVAFLPQNRCNGLPSTTAGKKTLANYITPDGKKPDEKKEEVQEVSEKSVYEMEDFIDHLDKVKELDERNRAELKRIGFDEEEFPFEAESYAGNHLMKTVVFNQFLERNGIQAIFQGLRWMLVELSVQLEAARLMRNRTAIMEEKKQDIFYGWVIVAVSFVAQIISYAIRYNFPFFMSRPAKRV
jgi:hypothetical protein